MYTIEDTRDIFYGDHPDFDQEPIEEIEGHESRWSLWSTRIYQHTETGQHYKVTVGRGKTEMQEDEVRDPPVLVERREVKTTAKSIKITLPVGEGPLANYLDANGFKDEAQRVRGYVMRWEPVDQPRGVG